MCKLLEARKSKVLLQMCTRVKASIQLLSWALRSCMERLHTGQGPQQERFRQLPLLLRCAQVLQLRTVAQDPGTPHNTRAAHPPNYLCGQPRLAVCKVGSTPLYNMLLASRLVTDKQKRLYARNRRCWPRLQMNSVETQCSAVVGHICWVLEVHLLGI